MRHKYFDRFLEGTIVRHHNRFGAVGTVIKRDQFQPDHLIQFAGHREWCSIWQLTRVLPSFGGLVPDV